jgi:hypothetical protein
MTPKNYVLGLLFIVVAFLTITATTIGQLIMATVIATSTMIIWQQWKL